MSPAPLRLTVTLSPGQLANLLRDGGEIVMQASSAHAVVFEVAVALAPPERPQAAQDGPQRPAPVPAAPLPPARPAAAVPPGSRWRPTVEEHEEAQRVAADIERRRVELGYTAGEPERGPL